MTSGIDTSSRAADPIQDAVYNRVLMAAMAGRRTMVVSDYTGGNGAVTGRRMADYMSSSGGMALTATGYRNATLEDLLSEAAAGLGLKRSGDLEELALSLERALDAAGSGLLVIFDAHLLSAPVIGDLFELSGSDTDSGLYMQILLTGGPGLDAQFDKPGLANAARQVASSRWRIENEAPPVEEEQPAPRPTMAAAIRREPAPAAIPQPAFTRQRVQRREEDPAPEPAFEPPPLRKAPKARAYAVQPDAASGIPRARPVVAAGLLGARSWHSLRLRGGVRDERALALRPQKRHRVAEGGRPVRPDGQPAKHAPSPGYRWSRRFSRSLTPLLQHPRRKHRPRRHRRRHPPRSPLRERHLRRRPCRRNGTSRWNAPGHPTRETPRAGSGAAG